MATKNIGLSLPPYDAPNWNAPMNGNFDILDSVCGDTQTIAATSDGYILKLEDLQNMRINVSGNIGGGTAAIIFPDRVGGSWIVSNNTTTSGGKVILRTQSFTVDAIEVPAKTSILVYSDGANIYASDTGATSQCLSLAGGTVTGPVIFNGAVSMNGLTKLQSSMTVLCDGVKKSGDMAATKNSLIGFFNSVAPNLYAAMNLDDGKWTASGGLGIGMEDPTAPALAEYCPPAVQSGGEDDPVYIDVGTVLLSIIQELQILKSAVTTDQKSLKKQ